MLGGLRKDIQGLRAIAVVAVLLWHVDSATLPGGFAGVDVFFVVSGFLMTSLLAAPSRLGIREIADFYQRRVRRIIPAATVVLVVTAAGAAIRLDPSRWSQVGGDLVAATLFVVNWRFASRSVDYLASVDPPSPVQHYWSLAVEEQFYLLWPLLMAVAVALSHRRRRSAAVAVVSSAVVVASLLASWSLSASSPASAYFVTTTRLWELALGGLAVPLTAWMAGAPKGLRLCLGWLGRTAIAGSFCVIGPDDPFPRVDRAPAHPWHRGGHCQRWTRSASRRARAGAGSSPGPMGRTAVLLHLPLALAGPAGRRPLRPRADPVEPHRRDRHRRVGGIGVAVLALG